MRKLAALAALSVLAAGCLPTIPYRADFGTSALTPAGDTPSEFAQFNAYDPSVGPLVADQLCATPYAAAEQKTLEARPGEIVQTRGRCQLHRPFVGDGDFLPGMPQ